MSSLEDEINALGSMPRGIKRIRKGDHTTAWYWAASQVSRYSKGFKPRTRLLWRAAGAPTPAEFAIIATEAELLCSNLKAWQAGLKPPRPRLIKIGVVYFLSDRAGFIKIGFTTSLAQRITDLQIASSSELRLLATIVASNRMETEFKHRFRRLRVRGEWHKPGDHLIEFIAAEATLAEGVTVADLRLNKSQFRDDAPRLTAGRELNPGASS